MASPSNNVFLVTGKFALSGKNVQQGDVPFQFYMVEKYVPEYARTIVTQNLEKLTGLFVSELHFELISINKLIL